MADAKRHETTGQCRALTGDEERCSRPATEDEFCYQHDDSDPTVSDSQAAEQDQAEQDASTETEQEHEDQAEQNESTETEQEHEDQAEQNESTETEQEHEDQTEQDASNRESTHPRSGQMTADNLTDPGDVEADVAVDVEREEVEGILAIRESVRATAGQLIGREFDAVSEIAPTDEGWRAVAEVVERRSVPDTQDVIGRYEIELDSDGTVHGYRRLDRYRRGDTTSFE